MIQFIILDKIGRCPRIQVNAVSTVRTILFSVYWRRRYSLVQLTASDCVAVSAVHSYVALVRPDCLYLIEPAAVGHGHMNGSTICLIAVAAEAVIYRQGFDSRRFDDTGDFYPLR